MTRDSLNSIGERIIMNRFTEKIRLDSLGLDTAGNDRWMASSHCGFRHDAFIYFSEYISAITQTYMILNLWFDHVWLCFCTLENSWLGVGEGFGLNVSHSQNCVRKTSMSGIKPPWIGIAPPESNKRDEVSSRLCTSNTFSISFQRTLYIECSFRTFTSNPSVINELASARKHCIVALLTLFTFITLQPHIFPSGNANLGFIQ